MHDAWSLQANRYNYTTENARHGWFLTVTTAD